MLEDKSEPTRSPRPGQKALFPEDVRDPVARAFPHHGPVFPAQKPLDEASIGPRCRLPCAGLGRPQRTGRTGSTVPARQHLGRPPPAWPPACSPWILSLSPAHLPSAPQSHPLSAHHSRRLLALPQPSRSRWPACPGRKRPTHPPASARPSSLCQKATRRRSSGRK